MYLQILLLHRCYFLEAEDPSKDIHLYINSPGGSVSAGFAIYDTMQYIKCDVSTMCMGTGSKHGCISCLPGGAKGKRLALPNSEIMIHQPSGGATGTGDRDPDRCGAYSKDAENR